MATQDQKSNIITSGRQLSKQLIDVVAALAAFNNRFTAGGYSSLEDKDFIGANAGILAPDFLTAVSSYQAIIAAFDAGQDTNMEKITV